MIEDFNPDNLLSKLNNELGTSHQDLLQACVDFFQTQLNSSKTSLVDLEYDWLVVQTGLSTTIPDMWKYYFDRVSDGTSVWDDAFSSLGFTSIFALLLGGEGIYTGGSIVTEDYTGILQITSSDVVAIKGGRFSGGVWSDELADGIPLQPYNYISTATTGIVKDYIFYPLREDSTAYSVGDRVSIVATDVLELWMEATSTTGDNTTGASSPSVSSSDIDSTVIDNNVTWTVKGYHCIKGRENWPARTNYIQDSNDFTQWNKSAGLTVTPNSAIAPDGTLTADTLDNTSGASIDSIKYTTGQDASSRSWVGSVWLRADSVHNATIQLDDNSSLFKRVTMAVTTEWQKFKVLSGSIGGGFGSIQLQMTPGELGVSTGKVYAWMGQVEEGDYVTPSITTEGSTVTRAAAVDSHPTAGVLPANDFAIDMIVVPGATGQSATLWESKTDANNLVRIYTDPSNIYFEKVVAGTSTEVSKLYTHIEDTFFEVQVYQSTSGMGIRYKELGASWSTWDEDLTSNGQADAVISATQSLGSDGDGLSQFASQTPILKVINNSDPKTYLENTSG